VDGTLTAGSTIYGLGGLDVSGSATVDETLTAGSTIYGLGGVAVAGDLDVSGSATVDGTLTVGSTIYGLGNLDVSGSATVDGTLTAGSTIYGLGGLDVSGSATVDGTLTVGSTIYGLGGLDVSGSATVDGTLTVGSTIYGLGDLDVSGSATVDGTLTVGSTIYADGGIDISGDLDISGTLTIDSIETCALAASQGRLNVDCSYGYVTMYPNLGDAPGATMTYYDTRFEMFGGDVSGGPDEHKLRLFVQRRPDTGDPEARIVLTDPASAPVVSSIQFDASSGNLNMITPTGTIAMTVDTSGNIGIGVENPDYMLDVDGLVRISKNIPFENRALNPFESQVIISGSTTSQKLYLGSYYTSGVGVASSIQSADYFSGSNSYQNLLLNPIGGYVGVGVDSPGEALDVSGTVRGTHLLAYNAEGTTTGAASVRAYRNSGGGLPGAASIFSLETDDICGGQSYLRYLVAGNGDGFGLDTYTIKEYCYPVPGGSSRGAVLNTINIPTRDRPGPSGLLAGDVQVNFNLYVSGNIYGGITGEIRLWSAAALPAGGWLFCNGAAINRTTYANLFAVIGTTYGVGDGSTTFNVPDLRSRVPIGTGTGTGLSTYALGATGGEESHTLTVAEMPAHSHNITDPGHSHSGVPNQASTALNGANNSTNNGGNTGAVTTGITIDNTGGGGAHENRQPYLAINYIIKY
jgi:microcystin-dependent protein/cytoskeletal protein CcmA (bactofilin family)